MRIQDIKVGEYYRLKNTSGEYCESKSLVKCEHTVNKNDTFRFIRYFRPMDLVDTKGK